MANRFFHCYLLPWILEMWKSIRVVILCSLSHNSQFITDCHMIYHSLSRDSPAAALWFIICWLVRDGHRSVSHDASLYHCFSSQQWLYLQPDNQQRENKANSKEKVINCAPFSTANDTNLKVLHCGRNSSFPYTYECYVYICTELNQLCQKVYNNDARSYIMFLETK